jgi:anaerobic selenocysteine-containing dehydrogenase
MKQISACTMDCPDACSLVVTQADGEEVVLRGNPAHPFTAGFTCKKIKHHIRRLRNPNRILQPIRKDGTGWRVISWNEALDLCAEKIQECRSEPESMLHIPGDGAKGVLKEGVKLFFGLLGASRTRGSLCDAAGYMAYIHDFGSRKQNTARDLLNAAVIINWGKDLSRSSVHVASLVRKARKSGNRVISISPGGDGNADYSDHLIQIRPGTDRFLAAAVIRRFIEADLIPSDILSRTRHWDSFRKAILDGSEDRLARTCEVSKEDIQFLFQAYRSESPAAAIVGGGLQRYRFGGENVRYINALSLISGNMGRPGGGSYFHLHSLGNFNLGWATPPDAKHRRFLLKPIIGREILSADNPKIRMLWVNGGNIVNQAADSKTIARAFEKVPFKVVVDAFMTDTAVQADLILPSTLMLEQEDIIASFLHDYIQYVPAALSPPGEARDDYGIVRELGKRLDPPVLLPDRENCFRASLKTDLLDTSLEELRSQGSIKAEKPDVAYADLRFDHPDGLARFPTGLHEEPDPPEGYPMRLLTLVRRDAIHSQMLPEDQEHPPVVRVSPDNPVLRLLNPAQTACLVSPIGRMQVTLEALPRFYPGAVLYRRGDWMKLGGGANQLIEAGLTDLGNGAAFYDQYVRLENSESPPEPAKSDPAQ